MLASDPLNSASHADKDEIRAPITETGDSSHPDEELEHSDFNVLPIAGGSTDLGVGGGFFAGLARVNKPGADPFLWNIDSSGLITFKLDKQGVSVPYVDIYARLTVPRLFGAPIRLELRPSYTSELIDYFGMGNAAPRRVFDPAQANHNKYQRGHPQFDVDLRTRLVDHLSLRVGFRYIYNAIRVPADSELAEDQRAGSDEVKRLIGETASHSVFLAKYGLAWDTRDQETSAHHGTFDTLDLKLSPGGTPAFPYRYGEATLNLRAFLSLGTPRVVLAVRVVGDCMFGQVPFYELARFDDTFALGGTAGVRGIPAQRYYGKLKVLGNVELRLEALSFRAFGKPMTLAVVPLFDAGRLWADWHAQPELDGRGLGIKYGVGGGLRLQSGSAFVIRVDVVDAPVEPALGGYLAAGQMF